MEKRIHAMVALLFVATTAAQDLKPTSYPAAAPLEQYRMGRQEEIALARTAAPPSISGDADVLVLGAHGYESAAKGKNGFVCYVERSWGTSFDDLEFWNPKLRQPNCFNPLAVRSVLPVYLKRTEWVLAGADKPQMIERTKTEFASHRFPQPETGSFSFMLSRIGYSSDKVGGAWFPHVMLFVPHGHAADWGAGLEGSPILGEEGSSAFEATVLFIPVRRWSDGSMVVPPATAEHKM